MCIAYDEKYREKRLTNIAHCDSSYTNQVPVMCLHLDNHCCYICYKLLYGLMLETFAPSCTYEKKPRIRTGESGIKLDKDMMANEQTEKKPLFHNTE